MPGGSHAGDVFKRSDVGRVHQAAVIAAARSVAATKAARSALSRAIVQARIRARFREDRRDIAASDCTSEITGSVPLRWARWIHGECLNSYRSVVILRGVDNPLQCWRELRCNRYARRALPDTTSVVILTVHTANGVIAS